MKLPYIYILRDKITNRDSCLLHFMRRRRYGDPDATLQCHPKEWHFWYDKYAELDKLSET